MCLENFTLLMITGFESATWCKIIFPHPENSPEAQKIVENKLKNKMVFLFFNIIVY